MTKSNENLEKTKLSTRFNSLPIRTNHEKVTQSSNESVHKPNLVDEMTTSSSVVDLGPPALKLSHDNSNNTTLVIPNSGPEITVTDNDEISSSYNETTHAPDNTLQLEHDSINQAKLALNASNPNTSVLPMPFKIRHDSFKQFTDRFRSFSIDLFRSIEMAHDVAEQRNKKFSTATQTAAAQMYSTNTLKENDSKPPDDLVEIEENELTPNHTQNKLSVCEENDKSASLSSNDRFASLGPNSHSKGDSPFEKAINNLNRNSFKPKLYSDRILEAEKCPQENEVTHSQTDQVDYRIRSSTNKEIPDDIHISVWEVFIYMWGIITFFADLISDIILSAEYFNGSKFWLGFMTLMLVLVPNITLSLFSLSWYIDKHYSSKQEKSSSLENDGQDAAKPASTCDSITFWITTVLFVIFQIDLIWKYIQGFIYTVKGWACRSLYKNLAWEKYYIEKQIKCDTDIGMLRLIDVFMDSGPQVLLQLYVITTQNLNESGSANLIVFTFRDFKTTSLEFKQFFSILSSLLSMGYALAGYQRCLRNQQFIFCLETNKPLPRPISWFSTIMQFLWYLFLIAPRVLSLAIFASTFRSWFFMIVFTHWFIMYFWILRLKTNYCISSPDEYNAREEIFEKFYDFVCSFIYIFVYFNLKSGTTRYRYLIYYIIFYSENLIFSVCYFLFSKEINLIYKLSMLLIVIIGFWIAITFQILYYLHCHPSHDIRICVKDAKGGGCISISKKTLNKRSESLHLDDSSSVYRLNPTSQPVLQSNNKLSSSNTCCDVSMRTNQDNMSSIKHTATNLNANEQDNEEAEKERSMFSLSSTSSSLSPFSSLPNLSQTGMTHSSSSKMKNSFSKSTISLSGSLNDKLMMNQWNLDEEMNSTGVNLNDSFWQHKHKFQYENAPMASIKEFLTIDEDELLAKDLIHKRTNRQTSVSSKNS